jgi:hypothetical protein
MLPLLSVVADLQLRNELQNVARNNQASIVAERGLHVEAQVLEILAELMLASDRLVMPVADITLGLIRRYGSEYERPITNRWIGSILRKTLNLRTYKSHGVYVVPMNERQKVELLCGRYGVSLISDIPPTIDGDVGALGTS